ncbi:hypothetical protein CHUV0807_0649 [Cardiobacterium hominis]|uniref:Uncharacterized protein n=1 Tax=Cardiobacterium hominis TaxID=2718 RepID=A0A1C3H2Z3_9GAMM|nr:hypothetical protein CHUV0807_0649 [Cardiobacterium hominis]
MVVGRLYIQDGGGAIIDEPEFRFFNCLPLSPQPQSRCANCSSPRGTSIARVAREGLVRRIVNTT